MYERFNSLPGMSCQPADGAMYLFPKIDIPPKAVEEAKKRGKEADVMYALELLGMSSPPSSTLTQVDGDQMLRVFAVLQVLGSDKRKELIIYELRLCVLV